MPALWEQVVATIAPNGAETDAGVPVTQAVIIPVPPLRLPAPLPPGARPQLVISVQAIGATNFDTPAAVCFPNLPDPVTGIIAGAGALQELLSFNHDAGRWDPVGPMRVSTDGRLVWYRTGRRRAGAGVALSGAAARRARWRPAARQRPAGDVPGGCRPDLRRRRDRLRRRRRGVRQHEPV